MNFTNINLQYSSAPATSALLPPPLVLAPPVSSVGSSLPPAPATSNHSSVLPEAHAVPPGRPNEDLRNLTFQQALPHLAQLAEDAGFVDAISTIRKEQADLERRLWDERAAILRKHEEKVKVARTKATLVGGTGLTQYEADVMSDAFRQELRKFDAQRVLPAWDGLVAKQQAKLEALGVPAMFSTTSGADRQVSMMASTIAKGVLCRLIISQRQQRVIQVLVGIAGPSVLPDCNLFPTYPYVVNLCTPLSSLLYPVTMPFVDLVSGDDYASIWYDTNAPNGNVGGFDPAKPTVVLLHPLFLDSSWMFPQMDDHRLHSQFNIIVFDTRMTGKSMSRPTGKFDLWVAAADLAFCFYHLRISPAHIFAPELNAYSALRFSVLSVAQVIVRIRSVFEALEELTQLWSFSEDMESFEYSSTSVNQLVAYWEVHYPPFRRTHVITNVNLLMNRTPLTPEELARITCPVFVIQAESSQTHPVAYAEQISQHLTNVPGGSASIFPVKASQGYLSLMSASIVNQVFIKFLSRQPPARSDPLRLEGPLADRMRTALATLGKVRSDPSMVDRDPLSPLSFSCASAEVIKSQEETRATYEKGQRTAFSPLGLDGRPLRKFSERKDHWLDGGADGFSYSSAKNFRKKTTKQKPPRRREAHEVGIVLPPSEPVSEEAQQVSRLRRATINPSAVDKQVIKGSMAKVVSTSQTVVPSLPRLLR
ncbi:uncharacterized protein B0H18DRAFT_1086887 [Fomitopsis serialis]|uniref:uncharacterized protein n=1 Tax=Fomitopsis serialis TaxID=139415 RepID=UPI002007FEF7|nr:uncharacterized protein B0H18DRAFT_1086887 [Neoantrodia serialis]KAH9918146.1 hypothetical protein B0H18DRAFT_1086887 [Neoantrodia serialis]